MTSGVTLREERLANGVQQQELAAEMGIGHSALAQLEQRERVRPATAARFREALSRCIRRQAIGHIDASIETLKVTRRALLAEVVNG